MLTLTLLKICSVVLPLFFLTQVEAQATSNVTCPPAFDWMKNSLEQNPCLVAAYLSMPCNSGQWNVPTLTAKGPYNPPNGIGVNGCRCNSVVYSLISACSVCQDGLVGTWIEWSSACGTVGTAVGQYPNPTPNQTVIPGWSTIDPNATGGSFNATNAQLVATSPPKKKSSNIGAIVGGVVGGVIGLALIALLIWYLIRRRTTKPDKITPMQAGETDVRYTTDYPQGRDSHLNLGTPAPTMMNPYPQQHAFNKVYDPADPSTFPASPGMTSTYVHSDGLSNTGGSQFAMSPWDHTATPPPHGYQQSSIGGYNGHAPPKAGQYTGVAEV